MSERGSAVTHLYELGRRYVSVIRVVTWVPSALVAASTAAAAPSMVVTVVMLSLVTGWSVVYVYALRREPGTLLTVVDAAVLAALALSAPWSVSPEWLERGRSWLLPLLAFACVGYQYYAGWLLGGLAALLVLSAATVGTAVALPEGSSLASLVTAAWSLIVASLARMLWTLVRRGGKLADDAAEDAENARAEQAAKARIRAGIRAHNRTLHDTAATTLLWVGTSPGDIPADLLAAQASRDLGRLLSWEADPGDETDLVRRLSTVIDLAPVKVSLKGPQALRLPIEVAAALADASREAIVNVARYANVDQCRVLINDSTDGVRIDVIDEGTGFDPDSIGTSRYGMRHSILGRIEDVGGQAHIRSKPGEGTTVSLEWRR